MPEIISPIDGSPAYSFTQRGRDDALAQLGRARAAQREWRQTTLHRRVQLCEDMLDRFADRLDDNAEAITRMMGKPLAHARGEFLGGFCQRTRYLCSIAQEALAESVLSDGKRDGIRRMIRREPVGVALVIAAWNYPLLVPVGATVCSLLAGNAVLIKHAPQTALVADQLARAFAEAGAPEDLVQALHVDHPTAAEVIDSRLLGFVSFTGSVRGGHEVYRAVARNNFIGVGMELGGKDPAYVRADAPVAKTAANLVDGAFFNAGQSCCAIERIYVHKDIYDDFVAAAREQVHEYVVGDPLDAATTLGPVVNAAAASRVRAQVEQALAAGARQVTDDARFAIPDRSRCYLPPRVLVDVTHEMALMTEESFGPVVGIMRVEGDDEAIARMNDSVYGLTASVWTDDDSCALELATRLEAGTVFQNRCDYLDPALAWTGVKDSGHGASLSRLGFDAVTRPKSYHLRARQP